MLDASIELHNFDTALRAALAAATQQALDRAADQIRGRLHQQFLTEGAAYGNPWSPGKETPGPYRPLLFRSGRLRASLTQENHPDHIALTPTHLGGQLVGWLGTRVPYAALHQWGTRHLPQRQILTRRLLEIQGLTILSAP